MSLTINAAENFRATSPRELLLARAHLYKFGHAALTEVVTPQEARAASLMTMLPFRKWEVVAPGIQKSVRRNLGFEVLESEVELEGHRYRKNTFSAFDSLRNNVLAYALLVGSTNPMPDRREAFDRLISIDRDARPYSEEIHTDGSPVAALTTLRGKATFGIEGVSYPLEAGSVVVFDAAKPYEIKPVLLTDPNEATGMHHIVTSHEPNHVF